MKKIVLYLTLALITVQSYGQVDESKLGNWFIYIWNTDFNNSRFGLQGDVQHRNWNMLGDLEQLLIRGGLTYRPKNANLKLIAGYAHITSGQYGSAKDHTYEHRIYQECLIPNKVSNYLLFTHRFRYEQRFRKQQDFTTRLRYALFLNVPFNKDGLVKKSFYGSFYNELFINSLMPDFDNQFDRNRAYAALGYVASNAMKIQLGAMVQSTSAISKTQLQLGLIHKF